MQREAVQERGEARRRGLLQRSQNLLHTSGRGPAHPHPGRHLHGMRDTAGALDRKESTQAGRAFCMPSGSPTLKVNRLILCKKKYKKTIVMWTVLLCRPPRTVARGGGHGPSCGV